CEFASSTRLDMMHVFCTMYLLTRRVPHNSQDRKLPGFLRGIDDLYGLLYLCAIFICRLIIPVMHAKGCTIDFILYNQTYRTKNAHGLRTFRNSALSRASAVYPG